jgi:predicted RecA/RadA family phage recombinase
MPEAPGSSDGGGVTLESYNTAWDLSDLTNPTLVGRVSELLTQPIGAHGTVYRFDNNYSYLYTYDISSEFYPAGGEYVRYDASAGTSLEQLVPSTDYLFTPAYTSSDFAPEPQGYSMMTSPYNARTYWEYGFDPSGLYDIRNPLTIDTDPNNPAPWVGPLMVEWDHLGTTGVTGFTAFLGELLVVASDQQSTGLAIYNTAGLKDDQIPQLVSTFKPILVEPSGNPIGIGGYWLEPYGANKMVWAARQRETTPIRTHPALFVVDFTDPANPVLSCELYFNQDYSDPSDGDASSDPMYVNFQDQYAYVDHFKVDIPACEAAYLADQTISPSEFSEIVYKFEDRANHCDSSQYFRPLGQVGVFGGYDGVAAAVVTYTGGEQMRDGATYMRVEDLEAWGEAGNSDETTPDSLLITHHYSPNVASSPRASFGAGDEVMDTEAYWETGEFITFTLTDVVVDERVNEQGMCFFVTSDEPDTNPPYVSGHRPLAGQTNYPIDGLIHLHIPETLRAETVTHAITVTNLSTNQPVAFRHQLSHTGTLGIWPEANFDTDTNYRVNVAGIQDYMGNTMVPYSFSFTTGDGNVTPTPEPEPTPPAPSVEVPYYPNHSGKIACESGEDYDSVWVVNPDNDSVSLAYAYTDPETYEVVVETENDAFIFTDSTPSSISRVGRYTAVTYSDTDRLRFNIVGWWGTMPFTAWSLTFKYGSRPVASVAHGDMLYVALYGSGEIAKIDTISQEIVSIFKVGPKPQAMALTSDGSRLLVTRFISSADHAEVYDIDTAGNMSFRDEQQPSIRINKVRVPDDIDHGSGVPNYLRGIVIDKDNAVAYVTANKANIDRGTYLNGQALDDDNTIRPMIAVLDLVNHRDMNVDPLTRDGTIDLDNSADPAGITFLPDGVTRVHSLQGNNVVAFNNLAQNTSMRANTGAAPQDMCTTLRSLYVKNYTDRTVSVIDTAGFMYDGRQGTVPLSVVTVPIDDEIKTAEELQGLQIFYHARTPDISPEGYISCASCHDNGGHDGMTWDLTHMGEGLRNTISLRGASGTRFGNLHWSSNFDEVQDFEAQIEHLNGADGLIAGITFPEGVSPLTHVTTGYSEDLDALAAYVGSLGKESVLRSPNSCNWGGICTSEARSGSWQFFSHGCVDCHTRPSFRDGETHDMGTITEASGQRLGSSLTAIRTPTLIELWDTAPYFHDGSAATLEEVMSTGEHADMGLDAREERNLIQYLLNLDRIDYIDDEDILPADNTAPVMTIAGGYIDGDIINIQVDELFSAPTASAIDDIDGDVNVASFNNVDITTAGSYNINFSAVDASGNNVSAELIVIVHSVTVNVPPSGVDDLFTTAVDTAIVLPFSSIVDNDIDPDSDLLTILIVDDWTNGTASIDAVARTVTFTPNSGFSGSAQFTYAVTDGNDGGDYGLMGFAIVRLSVEGEGVITDIVAPEISITGYIDGETIDRTVGSIFIVPTATAIDNVDGPVAVTPSSNVDTTIAGTYHVNYSATDDAGNNATAILTVEVAIAVPNTAPIAVDDNEPVTTRLADAYIIQASDLTVNDTDAEDDALTINTVASAANASVQLIGQEVHVTPLADFTGVVSFEYTVFDGVATSAAAATVSFTVTNEPVVPPAPSSLEIAINNYPDNSVLSFIEGETFVVPHASAMDSQNNEVLVTQINNVNMAVANDNYVITYTAIDGQGNEATANLRVRVLDTSTPSVRQFTFNHSLWDHAGGTNTTTGYWVGELAIASGTYYAWSGQFGQLDYTNLSPISGFGIGSTNSPDLFTEDGTPYSDFDTDNTIIMPSNFQHMDYIHAQDVYARLPLDATLVGYANRVVDTVVLNQPDTPVYIYEHWHEVGNFGDVDLVSRADFSHYNQAVYGTNHEWFLDYQNGIQASRSDVEIRMIPVGPIIAEILENSALQASALNFNDMYFDTAPHGTPNTYLLAGLITYQAMYAEKANASYIPPITSQGDFSDGGVSREIAEDFSAINDFVWERLNHYNNSGVSVWP